MSLRAAGRCETGLKNSLANIPTRHTGDIHCTRCILNGEDVMKEGELHGRALEGHQHDNYTPKIILQDVPDGHSTTSALGGIPDDTKVTDLRTTLDAFIIDLLGIS